MGKLSFRKMVKRAKKQRVLAVTHLLPYSLLKQDDRVLPEIIPNRAGNRAMQHAVYSLARKNYDFVWVGVPLNAHLAKGELMIKLLQNKFILKYNTIPVFVSLKEHFPYYQEFCKKVLWPCFHFVFPDLISSFVPPGESSSWKHYVDVNVRFCDIIVEHYRPGNIIWINDYHFLLLPSMIRQSIPTAKISFFLHTPFPSSEVFRSLHVRKELLEGMLGADLIGFQTPNYARHFLQSCSRILGADTTPSGVKNKDTNVAVRTFSIGIDPDIISEDRKSQEVLQKKEAIRKQFGSQKIIIALDELDPFRGITQKLEGFKRLLLTHPEYLGMVTLIQVTTSIPTLNVMSDTQPNFEKTVSHLHTTLHTTIDYRAKVTRLIQDINSTFGRLNWTPVHHVPKDSIGKEDLALLEEASVALVTSLRDGWNIICHKYILCQEIKKSPLVLSEFAGASGSFRAALRINPWSPQEISDAIDQALLMSDDEKITRWKESYDYVASKTAQKWAESLLKETASIIRKNERIHTKSRDSLDTKKLISAYNCCERRMFLLNYDDLISSKGDNLSPDTSQSDLFSETSVSNILKQMNLERNSESNITLKPEEGQYCEHWFSIVNKLSNDPRNMIYLYTNGTREEIGKLKEFMPGVGFCAENGAFIQFMGRTDWLSLLDDSQLTWRSEVLKILEYYSERTPESRVIQQEVNILWDYSQCDEEYSSWQASECANHLEESICHTYPVFVCFGEKNIEVQPKQANMGFAVNRILAHHSHVYDSKVSLSANETQLSVPISDEQLFCPTFPEFIFSFGNGKGDESMFVYLSSAKKKTPTLELFSCTYGFKQHHASHFVNSRKEVQFCLSNLAQELLEK